jgi:hypothetical protein
LKQRLGCRFGFHRWGPWTWDSIVGYPEREPMHAQNRYCQECPAKQGPLVSSEGRRMYEGWRDR